jgi:hypothetical protein
MAGLEPARAFYGPTDFKSVASTISPHRRLLCILALLCTRENEFPIADLHLERPKTFRDMRPMKSGLLLWNWSQRFALSGDSA